MDVMPHFMRHRPIPAKEEEKRMADNTISKETLRSLLGALSKERTLVGPIDTGKVVEFRPATPDEVLMDDRVSYKSAKEYYFPQVEKLLTFGEEGARENETGPGVLLFGAKPCDLEALRVLNEVFMKGRYADPFFAERMEKNLVIGVGCQEKKPACFCDALGLDMHFSDFCDILLAPSGARVPSGDGYTVEHVSEKGRAALAALPETAKIQCDNSRQAQAPEAILGLDPATEDAALFDAINWQKETITCQGCGMCTYICPTCHCFEFKDVTEQGEVARYRCWDSCIYPKFTLHASGHNPRARRWERYRQRVLHKYLYVPQNTGLTACTGCGRCIRSCPVGMNIRAVAESLQKVEVPT